MIKIIKDKFEKYLKLFIDNYLESYFEYYFFKFFGTYFEKHAKPLLKVENFNTVFDKRLQETFLDEFNNSFDKMIKKFIVTGKQIGRAHV